MTRKTWSACGRKNRYDSESAAVSAKDSLPGRVIDPARLEAYPCPIDPTHWHIGHMKVKKAKERGIL